MPLCLEIPFGNAVSFIATWQCRYNATWRGGGCVELFCFLSYFPRGSTVKKLFCDNRPSSSTVLFGYSTTI